MLDEFLAYASIFLSIVFVIFILYVFRIPAGGSGSPFGSGYGGSCGGFDGCGVGGGVGGCGK